MTTITIDCDDLSYELAMIILRERYTNDELWEYDDVNNINVLANKIIPEYDDLCEDIKNFLISKNELR
jgi:hypothetical protein